MRPLCIVGSKLLPLRRLWFSFRWRFLIGGWCWLLLVGCLGCCFVGWLLLVGVCCFALLVGLYLCPCIVHALELGSGPGSASNGAVETGAAAFLRTIGFLAQ